jgi:hypothetical protein
MSEQRFRDDLNVVRLEMLQQEARLQASTRRGNASVVRFLVIWFVLSASSAIGMVLGLLSLR